LLPADCNYHPPNCSYWSKYFFKPQIHGKVVMSIEGWQKLFRTFQHISTINHLYIPHWVQWFSYSTAHLVSGFPSQPRLRTPVSLHPPSLLHISNSGGCWHADFRQLLSRQQRDTKCDGISGSAHAPRSVVTYGHLA
jgi:hypothetical protein